MAQLLGSLLPDGFGRGFAEQLINAEIAFQLEMRPMVERIAQGVRDRPGPGQVLFFPAGIARTVLFGAAIRAHGSPFVVVTAQPDLP